VDDFKKISSSHWLRASRLIQSEPFSASGLAEFTFKIRTRYGPEPALPA
jgi:hypothetical protein